MPARPPSFLRTLLKVAVGSFVLIAVGLTLLILLIRHHKARYHQLADTQDLQRVLTKMADGYLEKRPKCALTIGILQKGRREVLGRGLVQTATPVLPGARTQYEIGSVTKLFTAIALAEACQRGELSLTNTLREVLPAEVKLPPDLAAVTLLHLATHTAGLPRLPGNLDLSPARVVNPYVDYRVADLYQALGAVKLTGPPGRADAYSNFGFGLLGHIVSLKSGLSYEALIRERILLPLGMSNSAARLSEDQLKRLAPGHDAQGAPVANWDFDALAGAGGLRSCVEDLLVFLDANLEPEGRPLAPALRFAQERRHIGTAGRLALGWQRTITLQGDLEVFWHNGGTGGYVSFLAFHRASRTAVVLLSNYGDAMAGDASIDKLGMEILKLATKISLE